jgi:hypothetical protein
MINFAAIEHEKFTSDDLTIELLHISVAPEVYRH